MRRILIGSLGLSALFGCYLSGDPSLDPYAGLLDGGAGQVQPGSVSPGASANSPAGNGGGTAPSATMGDGGGSSVGAVASGLPCDVQRLLETRCQSCHSSPPAMGVPMPLMTYADLMATAASSPTSRVSDLCVARMQDTIAPMPPAPAAHATSAEIATMHNWLTAGHPSGSCGGPANPGAPAGKDAGGAGAPPASEGGTPAVSDAGGATPDSGSGALNPFNAPPKCTSGTYWTGGNNKSPLMHPGRACITCHKQLGALVWAIAGTVFPSAHEPDDCNGANGGATVIITDAKGAVFNLAVNAAGNFMYDGSNAPIAVPYRAQVTQGGRVRAMAAAQTVGDCNSCHTQSGTNKAPGRILLP